MNPTRILGIDPGLRRTGWGMIITEGSRLSFLACGVILSDEKLPLSERLKQIHHGIAGAIAAWSPDESAIEETFVNKDAKATLKLGHARGVAMLACAEAGLSVAEYAPNQVKKTIVGAGHAEKQQVQAMVKVLLPKSDFTNADAADALAVALAHAQHRGLKARLG
ncbi:MAG: crossover junction endodeoxyribonuclease RuvC [Bosea sp. (in: a-proteobacteria)]